jgi:hypothetical protein
MKVEQIKLPAHWASALVNGDRSGMTDEDEAELDNYLAENPELHGIVSCKDDKELEQFHLGGKTLLCEVATYTYHVNF